MRRRLTGYLRAMLLFSLPVCLPGQADLSGLAALRRVVPESPGLVVTLSKVGGASQVGLLNWAGAWRALAQGFTASADPDVSFDGKRIVFAGRRTPGEPWQIYEVALAGGEPRRITNSGQDCRRPVYQSRVFSLDIPLPWAQVAYVSGGALRTAKLDGSLDQRVTFTAARDTDPVILPDGRMVYASAGKLMGVNLDGTDYALFAAAVNPRSPAVVGEDEVVFVEGAGSLASVKLMRPLHTRRMVAAGGVFQAPSGLPDGTVLASWQPAPGAAARLVRVDPATGKKADVYARASESVTQAKLVAPHGEPAGRGSVVDEAAQWARLYCLSVYTTDRPSLVNARSVKTVRVLGGPAAQPRKLGEAALEADGSFHLEIPPDTPVKLELLSATGAVVRSSAWIYARKKENRGCIGCHEDPELTPENREAQAIVKKPVSVIPAAGGTR